jgi:hypothetical protein
MCGAAIVGRRASDRSTGGSPLDVFILAPDWGGSKDVSFHDRLTKQPWPPLPAACWTDRNSGGCCLLLSLFSLFSLLSPLSLLSLRAGHCCACDRVGRGSALRLAVRLDPAWNGRIQRVP